MQLEVAMIKWLVCVTLKPHMSYVLVKRKKMKMRRVLIVLC